MFCGVVISNRFRSHAKLPLYFFLLVAGIFTPPPLAHADPSLRGQIAEQISQILSQLGYEDQTGIAQTAMDSTRTNQISKSVLEQQMDRFQIKNIARDLSAQVISAAIIRMRLHPDRAEKIADDLAKVATDLTKLRLTLPADGLDPEVLTKVNEKDRKEAIDAWTKKAAQKEINEAKVRITSNFATLIFGESELKQILSKNDENAEAARREIRGIESQVAEYLVETFSRSEFMQSRALGKAFVLAIAAESKLETEAPQAKGLEGKLDAELQKNGDFLSNYTTESFKYRHPLTGKIITVPLRHGDVFMAHPGYGESAHQATAAIISGGTSYLSAAWSHISNIFATRIFTSEEKLYEKTLLNKPFTWWERISHLFMQLRTSKEGYSRAGLIANRRVVIGNASLATSWVKMSTDSVGGLGGIVDVSLNEFAENTKIGIASLNDRELARHFVEAMEARQRETGEAAVTTIKDGSIYKVSKEGVIKAQDKNALAEWPVLISPAQQKQLLSLAKNIRKREFARLYRNYAVQQMERFQCSENATAYGKGQTGTSVLSSGSAVIKAYEVGTGVAPNPKKDRWSLVVMMDKFFGGEKTRGLNLKETPVAPGTMAQQGPIAEEILIDATRGQNEISLKFAQVGSVRPPISDEVTRLIRPEMKIRQENLDCDNYAKTMQNLLAVTQFGAVSGEFSVLPFMVTKYQVSRTNRNEDLAVESRIKDLSSATLPSQLGEFSLTHDAIAKVSEYDELLRSWDFFDGTDRIKKSIEVYDQAVANGGKGSQNGLRHIVNRLQADRNLVRFQTLNVSREMAAFVMAELSNRLHEPQIQYALADLTARMLTMRGGHPPVKFPSSILAMPQATAAERNARRRAIDDYIEYVRRQQIEAQTRSMTADIINVLYGAKFSNLVADGVNKGDPNALKWQSQFSEIYKRSFTIVQNVYMNDTGGRANDFGQCLGSLINIEVAKDAAGSLQPLDRALRENLVEQNSLWEHFFGRTFAQLEDNGKIKRVEIKNENMLMVLSGTLANSEGSAIPLGASAANKFGRGGSWWTGMFKPVQAGLAMFSHTFKTDDEVAKEGMRAWDKLKDWAAQKQNILNVRGESHINYIFFRPIEITDSNGQKKTLWRQVVLDAYPNHDADNTGELRNAGGPRMTSTLQIIDRAYHYSARIAWRDSVEFRRIFIKDIARRRSQPELYDEFGYPKDGVAFRPMFDVDYGSDIVRPIPNSMKPEPMMIEISREDFIKLHFPGGLNQLESEIAQMDSKRFGSGKERRSEIQAWHNATHERVYQAMISTILDQSWIFQWVDAAIGLEPTAEFQSWWKKNQMGFLELGFSEEDVYELRAAYLKDNPEAVARIIRAHVYGTTYCSLFLKLTSLKWTGVDPEGLGGGGYIAPIKFLGKIFGKWAEKAGEKSWRGEKLSKADQIKLKMAQGADAIVTAAQLQGNEDVCSPVALVCDGACPSKQNIRFDLENRTNAERKRASFKTQEARIMSITGDLEITLPRSNPEWALGETFVMDESERRTMINTAKHSTVSKKSMKISMGDSAEQSIGDFEEEEIEEEKKPDKQLKAMEPCAALFAEAL